MTEQDFKVCSNCGKIWPKQEDFLIDPEVDLVGCQIDYRHLRRGLFLFNHLTCGTTMSIRTEKFCNLYDGPVFQESKVGTNECPEYCLHQDVLNACPIRCECAWVREILQLIKSWNKELPVSSNSKR